MKHLVSVLLVSLSLGLLAGCAGDPPIVDSIGKACTDNDQCPGDLFCSDTSPTDVCAAPCDSDTDCTSAYGSDFGCVNSMTRCARRCFSSVDCPGTECVPFTSGKSYCSNP